MSGLLSTFRDINLLEYSFSPILKPFMVDASRKK